VSFQPAIPIGGLAGWRFLERTAEGQRATFERGPMLQREIRYFEENIGKITSAEELVKDRQLLKVALGAFGLDAEIDKRFFIRRVLESDVSDPRSMANRLSERAFKRMTEAFGFGDEKGPNTGKAGFAADIIERYKVRQFEQAVGQVDDTLRLAMNFRREIADIAANAAEGTGWFTVLGSRPLRQVVETALGLPKEFGRIDVDRQRDMIRARMATVFGSGSIDAFKDPANVEKLVTRFLARAQIEAGLAGAAASPVLQLFQSQGQSQAEGLFSILAQRR
jgi:hypothetical protein